MRRRLRDARDALERIRRVRSGVEHQIAEAVQRGELAGLPGDGRPLPPDPDDAAGERWAAAHVLRNANALPEWIELRGEIFAQRSALVRRVRAHSEWLASRRVSLEGLAAERVLEHARATEIADGRFGVELRSALDDLNARIARHNLLVRAQLLQLPQLTMERLTSLGGKDVAS